jgi:hypothetical protein
LTPSNMSEANVDAPLPVFLRTKLADAVNKCQHPAGCGDSVNTYRMGTLIITEWQTRVLHPSESTCGG